MRKCILCGIPTNGSVGAAGLHWNNICQCCKDKEDRALSDSLKIQCQAIDAIFDCVFPKTERISV